MTTKVDQNLSEPDLIDRIAEALPAEVRSDFYREMRHCRSLPENDEMLRVLRIVQILTLLMVQIPGRIALEREKLDQILSSAVQKIQEIYRSSQAYQKQSDERLASLPDQIKQGISPDIIAAKINESLRQQFVQSTIPKTSQALGMIAEQMMKTTTEFGQTAIRLTNSYEGAAEKARQSIDSIESSISRATTAAKCAAEDLAQTFHSAYYWFIAVVAITALILGFGSGMLFQARSDGPSIQSIDAPRIATPPPKPAHRPQRKP